MTHTIAFLAAVYVLGPVGMAVAAICGLWLVRNDQCGDTADESIAAEFMHE